MMRHWLRGVVQVLVIKNGLSFRRRHPVRQLLTVLRTGWVSGGLSRFAADLQLPWRGLVIDLLEMSEFLLATTV